MKPTGMIRKIDDLGRIVIPKEIRRAMGICEGDPLEIGVEDGMVWICKWEEHHGPMSLLAQLKKPIEIDVAINLDTCIGLTQCIDDILRTLRDSNTEGKK